MICGPKTRVRSGDTGEVPVAPDALPRCGVHLFDIARKEWRRLATPLLATDVLSVTARAALAACYQARARWVEAEEHLAKGPALIKAPSGYVQQSPSRAIANKQLVIMGRFMAELGLTPSARLRVSVAAGNAGVDGVMIEIVTVSEDKGGNRVRKPMHPDMARAPLAGDGPRTITYSLDKRV